jgi:heme exporter protein A
MNLQLPPQENGWAIETQGLSKSFGHVSALQDITMQVRYGAFVTVLGPNAAGKTTLLRVLATLTRPSKGRVSVGGLDMHGQDSDIRGSIGWVGEQTLLYGQLSPRENLRFYGRMYGVRDLESRIGALMTRLGLDERQEDAVHNLSRGMQQRVAIARAILHQPPILLLDEPYSGLDRHGAAIFGKLLSELRDEGHTILMATHDLLRASELGGGLRILLDGRIVQQLDLETTPEDLQSTYDRYVGDRR